MRLIHLAAIAALLAGPAAAESIEQACIKSDRKAASRALCGCIQDVADLILTPADQRRAVTFFADPHKAQEVRQSPNRNDENFWNRYKTFGAGAQTYCS